MYSIMSGFKSSWAFSESKSLHVLEAEQVGEFRQAVVRHRLQVGAERPHDGLHRPLPNLKFK